MLFVIPNHFRKYVNLLKNINIQENIMLLEKDELSSKQNDVASTFKQHLGSIKDSFNLILGSKILTYHHNINS